MLKSRYGRALFMVLGNCADAYIFLRVRACVSVSRHAIVRHVFPALIQVPGVNPDTQPLFIRQAPLNAANFRTALLRMERINQFSAVCHACNIHLFLGKSRGKNGLNAQKTVKITENFDRVKVRFRVNLMSDMGKYKARVPALIPLHPSHYKKACLVCMPDSRACMPPLPV